MYSQTIAVDSQNSQGMVMYLMHDPPRTSAQSLTESQRSTLMLSVWEAIGLEREPITKVKAFRPEKTRACLGAFVFHPRAHAGVLP